MASTIPLGEIIRSVRKTANLSARELSARSNLSPSYVTKLEAGEIEPSLRAFARIAMVLGMTPAEITFCVRQEAVRTMDG
jgi:transcriptional regulator with XRE-family HTH domain